MKPEGKIFVSAAPVRVLRLLPRLNTEGPVRHAGVLARGLSPDFETLIATGASAEGETDGTYLMQLYEAKQRTINLNDEDTFKRLLHQFNPHIVHSHSIYGNAQHRIWTKEACSAKILHTYHGHAFQGHFDPSTSEALRQQETKANAITDHVICISETQRNDLVQRFRVVDANKTSVIPLGLDTDFFSRVSVSSYQAKQCSIDFPSDHYHVIIVGRLTEVKNHSFFIQSMKMLEGKLDRRCTAWIVGEGPLRNAVLNEMRSADTEYVKFKWLPWQEDIRPIMLNAHALVCTSHNEGTPLSMLEAMCMELPIVSADVGGIADVITHEKTGLLYPPNSAATFTEKLIQLLTNTSLASQLKKNARDHVVANYSHHRLVDDVKTLYMQLLKH